MTMDGPAIKGAALAARIKYMQDKATPEQQARIRARLSPAFRETLDRGMMPSAWYPFAFTVEINRALDAVLGRADASLIPKLGRYSAEQVLHGVYKIFFKLGSPEFIISRVANVWRQYYNSGKARVAWDAVPAGKQARLIIEGFEAPARENCLSMLGWIEGMLHMAGARDVRVEETTCRCRGGEACVFTARWR